MEKLNIKEFCLLSWLMSWCESYECMQLKFASVQKVLPFIINRKEFDSIIKNLCDKGFLFKFSDRKNVTYKVNLEKIENYENDLQTIEKQTVSEAAAENQEEQLSENLKEAYDAFDLAMADYHESEGPAAAEVINLPVYVSVSEEKAPAENKKPAAAEGVLTLDMPAEEMPKTKKRKLFEIPEVTDISDYMYNYLVKKGLQNINAKLIAKEAEKFFCFYNSKNWKVGKSTMSNWRSAAAGWLLRSNINFCTSSSEEMSLQDFQKIVNPDGFKFMTLDELMHPRMK